MSRLGIVGTLGPLGHRHNTTSSLRAPIRLSQWQADRDLPARNTHYLKHAGTSVITDEWKSPSLVLFYLPGLRPSMSVTMNDDEEAPERTQEPKHGERGYTASV